jgi:signal transduction histidine kinase
MALEPLPLDDPDPLARTVIPLTASGQYTGVAEAAPPPGRGTDRRGLTVRAKLTFLYGGLFLLAGVILTAVTYVYIRWRLNHPRADLPPGCTITALDRAEGVRHLTAAQTVLCTRIVRADTLHDILIASLIGLAVAAVVAFGVGYWLAGRVLRPLSRITAAAWTIAQRPDAALRPDTTPRTRIALNGPPDELHELADTFDDMLDRLDSAFESQRRFTGNASHELRTPLAINRTLLEVALADPQLTAETERLATGLLETNERSERLIEGLLDLARADNAVVDPVPVDLAAVGMRAAAMCEAEAAQRGNRLRTDFGAVSVLGDGSMLDRVAVNLVQNALRYNVPGGWVDLVTYDQGAYGLLVVANTGPEVPHSAVESLFEPFRRLGVSAGPADRGAGLGLSIVRSVVGAHHGRIAVQPRDGGGLIVRVWVPVGRTRHTGQSRRRSSFA